MEDRHSSVPIRVFEVRLPGAMLKRPFRCFLPKVLQSKLVFPESTGNIARVRSLVVLRMLEDRWKILTLKRKHGGEDQ